MHDAMLNTFPEFLLGIWLYLMRPVERCLHLCINGGEQFADIAQPYMRCTTIHKMHAHV